jgi:hypothetical protein
VQVGEKRRGVKDAVTHPSLPGSADAGSLGAASFFTFCLLASFRDEFRGQIAFRLNLAKVTPETMRYVRRLSDDEMVILLLDHEKVARIQVQAPAHSGRDHKTPPFANVGRETFMGHVRSVTQT